MNDIQRSPVIKVLDEILINKIAAGEVIERPSSVVKELIENSLDAGAGNVAVELREGGLELIAVHDDGVGMAGEDLELAFTRHATSKLKSVDDLFNITSYGFRGEALPSIGSVARVTAISRLYQRDAGSELVIEAGKFKNLRAAGCPPGTSIIVSNLFFNTPARRKFLKSTRSEFSRITDLVVAYAIGNFNVGFRLTHDGRELFSYKPGDKLLDRLGAIYGHNNLNNFFQLPGTEEGRFSNQGTILGYISHPSFNKMRATDVRFYVNFRPIVSRTLMAAVRNGCHDKLPPNQYPVCALFINLPPREIDVNVHPAKTEIRFTDESSLFTKVKRLVEYTLRAAGILTDLSLQPKGIPEPHGESRQIPDSAGRSVWQRRNIQESLYKGGFTDIPYEGSQSPATPSQAAGKSESELNFQHSMIDSSRPKMWQFMDSFIIVPLKDSLLLIDQHNAHERILFEEAIRHLNSGKVSTQQMLFPITVDLTPGELSRWREHKERFANLGYEVSEFGGNTIIITGIPAGIDNKSPDLALRRILDDTIEIKSDIESPHHSFAASFACHSAIKAGQKLQLEEMIQICDRLFACQEFNLCPHGRPITARLTLDEIQKKFQRNVPSSH